MLFVRSKTYPDFCLTARVLFGYMSTYQTKPLLLIKSICSIVCFTNPKFKDVTFACKTNATSTYGPTVLRSYGPTVLRSYGPTVLRSYGPTVLRSYGPTVLRSYGPTVLRSYGPTVLRSYGPTVLRSYGPTVLRSYGPTVLRSYGFQQVLPLATSAKQVQTVVSR